jgi:hypothetical protein
VRGLAAAGFAAVLMETRQIRAALSSMTVKTDRNGCARTAHAAVGQDRLGPTAARYREQRARFAAGFWVPLPTDVAGRWAWSVREALAGNPMLMAIIDRCLTPPGHCAISSPFWKSATGTPHVRTPPARSVRRTRNHPVPTHDN